MRRWAEKVKADPYTTNPILRQALKDIGQIDAPDRSRQSCRADSGRRHDHVERRQPGWARTPRAPQAERAAREGDWRGPAVAGQFFKNGWSPHLADAADRGARRREGEGCADYVEAARQSRERARGAVLRRECRDARAFHARTPTTAILTDSRALVAAQGGKAVALLRSTSCGPPRTHERSWGDRRACAPGARRHAARAAPDGRASERAAAEMKSLGWAVTQQVTTRGGPRR